ncbi:MAG: SDR family oxidoreductase [Oligoflexus sp.]|jgi:NAD(P)-dependent dehydrogenase (short-subunit alcohol dehydrogenase family)
MPLQNKRIAITGAASGLGKALALQYAEHGWTVAVADIHDTRGRETVDTILQAGGEAFYIHCDVRKEQDLRRLRDEIVQRWGGLDMMVNNAGVAAHGAIDQAELEDWEWILDINLMGVVRGCRIFAALFKQQGYGHFVNIASMAGLLHTPEMNSYNVSKAGVIALSETLRTELAADGIKVTVVCPGFFPTQLAESMRSPDPGIQRVVEKLFAKSKLKAHDIAAIIYREVAEGTFYVLPHWDYRLLWYLKRYAPAIYFPLMQKMSAPRKRKPVSARRAQKSTF